MAMVNHKHIRRLLRAISRTPPGSMPGTLKGDERALESVVHLIRYDQDGIEELEFEGVDEIPGSDGRQVLWIDVVGLGDLEIIKGLGERFQIHELALADVVNTSQRPKLEEYPDNWYMVLRMPPSRAGESPEQLSLFIGDGFVMTFQERRGDCFEPVRKRLRLGGGRIRRMGADYLAYALLDAVVDHFFPVLDGLGERLEAFEEQILDRPDRSTVEQLQAIKHELMSLRRAVWPLREVVNSLMRVPQKLIGEETQLFMRDCYDHSIQVLEVVENYREVASGLMDLYLSSMGQRTNEVMQVLTIIATIFIPLGFIAGLYGMNFNAEKSAWNMPELNWTYGYPFALGLMAATVIGLLLFFRQKGWLGRKRS